MTAHPTPILSHTVEPSRRRGLRYLVMSLGLVCVAALLCVAAGGAQAAPVRAAETAGALPIGSSRYPVPTSQTVFVSPSGSDSARGSVSAPVRTIKRALVLAPTGGTVVLRSWDLPRVRHREQKTVTIQNYPGEAVWLDGAQTVTGWVADGSVWRKAGWNHVFDHSPTFTSGQADGTASWKFVNPAHPMASHPDQLWVNGVAMTQVGSKAQVRPGTFFYDEAGQEPLLRHQSQRAKGRSLDA